MNKVRIVEKLGRWYVETKRKGFFPRWRKYDYYFSLNEAEQIYDKLVREKIKPQLIKESAWL